MSHSPKRERTQSVMGLPKLSPNIDPGYYPMSNTATPEYLSQFWASYAGNVSSSKKKKTESSSATDQSLPSAVPASIVIEDLYSAIKSGNTPLTPVQDHGLLPIPETNTAEAANTSESNSPNLPSPTQSPRQSNRMSLERRAQRPTSLLIQGTNHTNISELQNFIQSFEKLPEMGKSYVLMHMLRRCPMPTLQFVSSTIHSALKRDIFSGVPLEVCYQILNYLDPRSIVECCFVSKTWYNIVMSEEADFTVWRRLLEKNDWIENIRWTAVNHVHRTEYAKRFTLEKNWKQGKYKRLSFPVHGTNVVTCLQFDEKKIVSGSDDYSIKVFDHSGDLKARFDGHTGGVWALQYINYTLVSGATDRSVRVWDMERAKCTHIFDGHTSTVRCLQILEPQFVPETGKYEPEFPVVVTGSRDSTIRVWRLPDPRKDPPFNLDQDNSTTDTNPYHIHTLLGHTSSVRAIAGSHNVVVSGSYDGTVRVWNIQTGECTWFLRGHRDKVYSVGYSHRLERAASGSLDQYVNIWCTKTGEMLFSLDGHTSLVGLLELSDKYLISAAADHTLRMWNPVNGDCLALLRGHPAAITCFNHDVKTRRIVSGSDNSIKVWELESDMNDWFNTGGRRVAQGANGLEPIQGNFLYNLNSRACTVWKVCMDERRIIAAVQKNGGRSLIEVFDFGDFENLGSQVEGPGDAFESLEPVQPVQAAPMVVDFDETEAVDPPGAPLLASTLLFSSSDFSLNNGEPTDVLAAPVFERQGSRDSNSRSTRERRRIVRRTS